MNDSTNTIKLAEIIYAAVRLIPKGKVASYSQIAALLGNCNLRRYIAPAPPTPPGHSTAFTGKVLR